MAGAVIVVTCRHFSLLYFILKSPKDIIPLSALWLKHTVYDKGANAHQWLIESDWLRLMVEVRVLQGVPRLNRGHAKNIAMLIEATSAGPAHTVTAGKGEG